MIKYFLSVLCLLNGEEGIAKHACSKKLEPILIALRAFSEFDISPTQNICPAHIRGFYQINPIINVIIINIYGV